MMKVKELINLKKELENTLGNVQDVRITSKSIIIYVECYVKLNDLLKLQEYFGVENLYVENQRDGVKIIVQ